MYLKPLCLPRLQVGGYCVESINYEFCTALIRGGGVDELELCDCLNSNPQPESVSTLFAVASSLFYRGVWCVI